VGGQLFLQREPTPGRLLEQEQSNQLLLDAFTGRTAADEVVLPVLEQAPPALPDDLNSLSFNSVIAEASTPYGGGFPARMHNIELAATLLNGTVIMPGQTFSFNSEIGPMTLEAGFQVAFGIANNEGNLSTVPAEAGGICQVATTVFQPVFAGGYEIVQRTTHSYWIPNYNFNGMAGLDATVEPAIGLDFKWLNNSQHAILMQAETDGQNFTVRLIGQAPGWTVEILPPEITNIVYADTETNYYEGTTEIDPGQIMRVERANDGFDVKIVRIVRDGEGERTFEAKVTYGTSRNVFLVGSESGELPADFVPPE
jgi:vancomycin resistance protein YoaR